MRVYVKMTINSYVSRIQTDVLEKEIDGIIKKKNHSYPVIIENPTPEDIIEFIIDNAILSHSIEGKPATPHLYKQVFLEEINFSEKKNYDVNMRLNDFIDVLEKENCIVIEQKEEVNTKMDNVPQIKKQAISKPISSKGKQVTLFWKRKFAKLK